MSAWTDRIKNHQIWTILESLGPIIDQCLALEAASADAIEGLMRLKAVLVFVGRRLDQADSHLLATAPIDGMVGNFNKAINSLNAYLSDVNAQHVVNANAQADSILGLLAQLNVPLLPEEFDGLRVASDAYRKGLEENLRSVQSSLGQISTDFQSLQSRVTELSAEVQQEKQRLSSLASEHQSQFSASQESRSKDFLDAQTARQEKFAALLAEYSQKLADQEAAFVEKSKELIDLERQKFSMLAKELHESGLETLAKMKEHLGQVEKLTGVVGNLAVTSGYQRAANEARWTARVWQGIALISMITITAFAYRAFIPLVNGQFTWEGFAGRLFVSLTVGVLAGYAISQADKYQQVERRSRKLALELEALGPFIAHLPDDKQVEFKVKVGERTFGTSDELIDHAARESPKTMIDFLKSKEIRTFITDLVKATKGGGNPG